MLFNISWEEKTGKLRIVPRGLSLLDVGTEEAY